MNSIDSEARPANDAIKRKLIDAQNTLIDRNLRNKLINCQLKSTRSKLVRVVDEVADEIFRSLLSEKKEFIFAPGRELDPKLDGEAETDVVDWVPPVEDLGSTAVAARHRDNVLQTNLTPDGLQSRLTAIYYESIEVEQEQGINILYLALGFLKWFEDDRSEIERYAPLILLPVDLTREGARERFKLKIRDEELFTNVSLKIWLAEQHSIELPSLPDDDEWTPSGYFESVRIAISKNSKWEVLPDAFALSFFSFNKYMLWRDLDPKNWPTPGAILDHKVLNTLLGPVNEALPVESPIIPADARVDNYFKLSELSYVLDADSSQTVAIQTALAGRNLVIQGPPGTGKSQTISNIVAAAIADGKRVLFVAEKLAALQVVFDRLRNAGLGHLCLELHSRKASKQQVLKQLKDAMDAPVPPGVPSGIKPSLDGIAARLWEHSDQLHKPLPISALTPFQILGRISLLRGRGVTLPNFSVNNATRLSPNQIDELLQSCVRLAERLTLSGVPSRHPWRNCNRSQLNPLDQERLVGFVASLLEAADSLENSISCIWPFVCPIEDVGFRTFTKNQLESIAVALDIAASPPSVPATNLCSSRWDADLVVLDELIDTLKLLNSSRARIDVYFTRDAWRREWRETREIFASVAGSLFRIFNREYRRIVNDLRTYFVTWPNNSASTLNALDELIVGQKLQEKAEGLVSRLNPLVVSVDLEQVDAIARLESISKWLHQAKRIEPIFFIRRHTTLSTELNLREHALLITNLSQSVFTALFRLLEFVGYESDGSDLPSIVGRWTLEDILSKTAAWSASVERYNEWPPVRDGLNWLELAVAEGFAKQCFLGDVPPNEIRDRVDLALSEALWNETVRTAPQIASSDGTLLNEMVQRFRLLDKQRISIAANEVAKRHFDKKPTGNAGDMGIIRAELNKSRQILPVRKLIARAGSAIQQLKPAFLMSPLSVSQYLEPGKVQFDLLVIDEASQVRPADALGAVLRASQLVVVGDPKQLPPTNFFNRLVLDEDEYNEREYSDEYIDTSAPLGAMESILSLCDTTFSNRAMLEWHYRSHHPALIAVSNRNFYDNKLLLPPSVIAERAGDGLGVVFHPTPSGHYERGRGAVNVIEADIVAAAVCDFARRYPDKSLGVGTFSVRQRDVIRSRIDARRRDDPSIEPFFSQSKSTPFFVKNLESIQGDERDVIFISVGYGRDRDGRLTQSFGPINAVGGERRLNVLISRARERCEVFSSITADDIDVSNGKIGTLAFREFLQYAEKGYFDVPMQTTKSFDSDFEESVANFVQSLGFIVHPQVGMAGFYIDLGVLDPKKPTKYLLGIECDGATYHSSRSARDRDRIRQEILESRGWRIYRIWSTDWFHKRKTEEAKLVDALGAAASPQPVDEPDDAALEVDLPSDSQLNSVQEGASEGARPGINKYIEAAFLVSTDAMPHSAPFDVVEGAVKRIIAIEGPIVADEVFRRLATVWGLNRTGNRIQESGYRALQALVSRGEVICERGSYITFPQTAIVVRDRSNVLNSSLRRAENLPIIEVRAALIKILQENVRVTKNELIVETARRFGFLRTGEDLRRLIDQVCTELVVENSFLEVDGLISLTAN